MLCPSCQNEVEGVNESEAELEDVEGGKRISVGGDVKHDCGASSSGH